MTVEQMAKVSQFQAGCFELRNDAQRLLHQLFGAGQASYDQDLYNWVKAVEMRLTEFVTCCESGLFTEAPR
jgi:hypothetical protein